MVGICAYAGYIPRYRLSRAVISSAMGWFNSDSLTGQKSVANYDEDTISMAVAAGLECLNNYDIKAIDGVYFATTSAPYSERQNAGIIATALDLKENIRSVDISNSLRAGTSALVMACEGVKSNLIKDILVCSSDCRLGKPGSTQEILFGDGAVAFIIGSENVLASFQGSYSLSLDFPGYWRSAFKRFGSNPEDRWVRDEGYTKFTVDSISGLLTKYRLKIEDFAKVIFPAVYPRDHSQIAKKLGLQESQVQDPMTKSVGECGTASALLMLAAALEDAKPDENILVVSYGNGAEALWFQATSQLANKSGTKSLSKMLKTGTELNSYEKYLCFRGILPVETGIRGEVGPTHLPSVWRDRKAILALCGSRCKKCGTPQYPPQRVCVNPSCGAIDQMEEYRFSDRKASLFSYTEDRLAFNITPPQMYGVVDFEGGGRWAFDITDCESGTLQVGMPMGLSFRRKYADELHGIYGYFWKAMPLRDAAK